MTRSPAVLGSIVGLVLVIQAVDVRPQATPELPGRSVGQELSRQADRLVTEGDEWQAVQLYLRAHNWFQATLLSYAMTALRFDLGGDVDERDWVQAGARVSEQRNVNLSKLWIVWDPDDRAHEQGLEEERTRLLERFDRFRSPATAEPLEEFLHRLYPEDRAGERQMDALRGGQLPPSKRWGRLQEKATND